MKIIIFLFISISFLYGYLDPATGSMLLYFIMGIVATAFFSIKDFFYKIKNFFIGLKNGKVKIEDDFDIIFYSEGERYWNVFFPILRHLKGTDIKCGYFSSDEFDEGLKYEDENISTKYLGSELMSILVLNNIKAKIVVMTTPQLDILGLTRSKNVKHYTHLIHAPTDALIYKPFAFDYFDSVMCSGTHQIKSIRELEKVRNLPQKKLLETGLTYYDVMLENKTKLEKDKDKTTILVAPTWGTNGMINKYGDKILLQLVKSDMNIIFRPHPQMYIDIPKQMASIEDDLSKYPNFSVDKNPSGEQSMEIADLLISDISGIIFDFAFIYQKPIVLLSGDTDISGLEAEFVSHQVWEFGIFDEIAYVVKSDEINDIVNIVKNKLSTDTKGNLDKIKSKYLFNFGEAGEAGSKQLIELLKEITS